MEPISAIGGVLLIVAAIWTERTIRRFQNALPKLRERSPLIRRMALVAGVLGVLSLVMSVIIPRL
jgi:hypothetical protein